MYVPTVTKLVLTSLQELFFLLVYNLEILLHLHLWLA